MGNFVKCQKCENNNKEYTIKFIKYEVLTIKNIPLPLITFIYNPLQHINIYKYQCSNGHYFNSANSIK